MAFCLVKFYLEVFGIFPLSKQSLPTALQKHQMFINFLHILFTGVSLLLYLSALVYFLIFKAKSIVLTLQAIFFSTVTLMRVTLYFLTIQKREQLSLLMDDLEQMVEMRDFGKLRKLNKMNIYSQTILKNYSGSPSQEV